MFKNLLKIQFFIILIISFIFSEEQSEQVSIDKPHISLVLHEELLNDFFSNIGEIKGSGTAASFDYTWKMLDPHIEIDSTGAYFLAKIRAKTESFRITKDVKGSVLVTYDKDKNIIEIKIENAKVILDVDIFGKRFVLTELNIGKYFSKALKINGPDTINNEIDYKLPTGESKKMKISTKSYDLILKQDAILLTTSLEFIPVDR